MAKGAKAKAAASTKAPAKRSDRERLERLEEAVRVLASVAGQTAHVEQVLEAERLAEEEEEA